MTSKTLVRAAFVVLAFAVEGVLVSVPACARSSSVAPPPPPPPPTTPTHASAAPTPVAPTPVATVAEAVDGAADATAVTRSAPQREDTFVTSAGADAWVKALPRARSYVVLDLAKGVAPASLLEITWRIHPSRTLENVPPDQDYAGNHPSRLELVLARGAAVRRLPLGEHGGNPDSIGLTSCRRLGYTIAPGDTPDEDAGWAIPPLPNLVSAFAMETMQGSTDFMLILGHDVLHVVHRFTHDGACPITIVQGPLSTCADMRWELFADVRITGEPRSRESVVELDAAHAATPFDCKHSYSGEHLVEP